MTEFRVEGKELIVKIIKKRKDGSCYVYLPRSWAEEKIAVIRGVDGGEERK